MQFAAGAQGNPARVKVLPKKQNALSAPPQLALANETRSNALSQTSPAHSERLETQDSPPDGVGRVNEEDATPDEKQSPTNVADEKLLPPRPEVDLATFQAAYGARDRAREEEDAGGSKKKSCALAKGSAAKASTPLEEDAGESTKKSRALAKGSAAKASPLLRKTQVSLRRNRVPWLRIQLQRHPLLLRKTQVSLRRHRLPWLRVRRRRLRRNMWELGQTRKQRFQRSTTL